MNNKIDNKLSIEQLSNVTAGGDVDSLKFKGKDVPLPPAKSKKPEDGGYAGIVKVLDVNDNKNKS